MHVDLLKEIDFSKELTEEPELKAFMKNAVKEVVSEEHDSLIKFKKPKFDEDLEHHLIVTNIPDLQGKEEKFHAFFLGFLDKKGIGTKQGLESLEIGVKTEGDKKIYNKTLYMIYKSPAMAKKAYIKLHQLKFDKEHTFACFTVKEFHAVERISDEYIKPVLFSKKEEVEFNFDENFRDQFVVRSSQSTGEQIYLNWFDNMEKMAKNALGDSAIHINSSISNVVFSRRGNYAAVCEAGGVRLFVGATLKQKAYFPHIGAIDVAFSPNETFMVSFNGNDSYAKTQENLIVWAVQEEIKLQSFKAHSHQDLQSFQFTKDEARLAIVGLNEIYLHNSENTLALKNSFKQSEDELEKEGNLLRIPNIQKTLWLSDQINLTCICYELNPAVNSNPSSKIFFINTKTKEERKWRAIGQHIKKVEVAMSENNEWIAVSFKKIQKRNLHDSVIYVVNLLKREVETEVISIDKNLASISWDKVNSRFGVVYEVPSAVKNDNVLYGVNFYQITTSREKKTQNVHKICEIDTTVANRLLLAQNGVYFALYNVTSDSPGRYKFTLGYFGKEQKSKKITVEIAKKDIEVSYMKFFEMDPSGRFIILGTDKAYHIWSMAGELIVKDVFNAPIFNVHFRPRYMEHLPMDGEKKLLAQEKDIKKKYEEEDEKRMNFLVYEREKQKQEQRVKFREFLARKKEWFAQFKELRNAARGFSEEDSSVKSAQYEYLERENL